MGKIIFNKSPIDSRDKISFETDLETILDVLRELNIDNEALAVRINGVSPDEIDLEYKIQENDLIEIARMVHGSSAGSKRTLAGILQIAAIAVSLFFTGNPYAGLAIVSALGLAAGYLNAKAMKMRAGDIPDIDSIDINGNNFSISSASNEARQLSPMPLPMGSIRFAPDYHTQPNGDIAGGTFKNVDRWWAELINPALQNLPPGAYNEMLPIAEWGDDTFSQILSPGTIQFSPYTWPTHEMAIMPTFTRQKFILLTTQEKRMLTAFEYSSPSYDNNSPVILYHKDPTDPFYGYVTTLWLMMKVADKSTSTLSQARADYNYFFGIGSRPGWWGPGAITYPGELNFTMGPAALPIAVPGLTNLTDPDVTTYVRRYHKEILNANDLSVKTYPGYMYRRVRSKIFNSIDKQAYLHINHVFNFGLGEMDLSEKAIEKTDISLVEDCINQRFSRSTGLLPAYANEALLGNVLKDDKSLSNIGFTTSEIFPDDMANYNFIYYKAPTGVGSCSFVLEGQLFYGSDTGMQENTCLIEVQFKRNNEANWSGTISLNLVNDNTKKYRKMVYPSVYLFSPDEYLEVRVRKRSLDSSDNDGKRVAAFEVKNFKFTVEGDVKTRRPFNLDFLRLSERTTNAGRTYKYSAQVDSYCYTYDFDLETWSWTLNRNPAFWFLFYARGGFYNLTANGNLTYPYGEGFGWVNYAGHPNSAEIIFGAGLIDAEIDLPAILEWAEFCEDNNIYFDAVIKEDTSCAEILEKIANVGRGNCTYQKGILSVIWQEADQPVVGMFGMSNMIAGSFSVQYNVANPIAKVHVNYINRDYDWETKNVESLVPFAESDNIKDLSITIDGITEEQQAQREANILAARQYFQRRSYNWKTDQEGIVVTRGQLVYLSHDATQYGYSGRIVKYNLVGGLVQSIETTSMLEDSTISHVTIRYPDSTMAIFECSVNKNTITFIDPYPIAKAPEFIDAETDNILTDYPDSMPDDFIFIAGAKDTPGKRVRIVERKSNEDGTFDFNAIDDDPAMWSYEFGPPTLPESFDDSEIVCRINNLQYFNLGNGLVKILWENLNGDYIKIINENTGLPIEANGSYSFSGGEVILELDEGYKYNLRIEPFVVGTPYKMEFKKITVWA